MLKKAHRLTERELRKVLKYRKPFFSYGLVANVIENRSGTSKFAIMFSGKHTKTSVSRNFFRRRFYDTVRPYVERGAFDIVIVPKKGKTFDKMKLEDRVSFDQDLSFLLKLVFAKSGNAAPAVKSPAK